MPEISSETWFLITLVILFTLMVGFSALGRVGGENKDE